MASEYRLVSYRDAAGAARAGVLVDDRVHPAAKLLDGAAGIDGASVLGILQSWEAAHPRLAAAAARVKPADGRPLAETALLAPILYPPAMFCAGANYWDHKKEMAVAQQRATGKTFAMVKPQEPWFFLKTTAHSVIGPGAPIRLPGISHKVDWEAELGVVIGRSARDVPVDRALEVVAGYVIVNDLSARDLMRRADPAFEGSPFVFDWLGQKCFDGAAPMGPWFTPAAYVPEPTNLAIKLWVSGALKQNSNTGDMVHSAVEQIAYLSRHVTLRPGDVIATGTPAGVGMPRGEFLKPGDEVRIEIDRCGTLVNPVVAG